jgi:hypothetical protein
MKKGNKNQINNRPERKQYYFDNEYEFRFSQYQNVQNIVMAFCQAGYFVNVRSEPGIYIVRIIA